MPGTIQARTHVRLALHVSGRRHAANTGYDLPCNTCTATLGTWVMNVLIMPPHLGHLALCLVTTLLRVGLVITLIPLLVSVLAITLVESWKLRDIRTETASLLTTGVSAVFFRGLAVIFTRALHRFWFALSPFSFAAFYSALLYLQ